jgi:hypothetical protein
MKRTFTIAWFGLSAAALFGCPVFSGGGGGSVATPTCGAANYSCCYTSWDCLPGQACEGNVCVEAPGDASSTDGGDCTVNGCPGENQACTFVDGGVACVATADGGPPDGAIESGVDGGPAADSPADAPVFTGCSSNADCGDAGSGVLCLDGQCVTPANQCTDTTQCPNSEECVQGGCVPTCSSTMPCPTGYSCTTNGVCTGNPDPCGSADGGAACLGDTTCVDQHCVTPCGTGDASCAAGLVCVDGGCIPDQKPVFVCQTDGEQGSCDTGSICLHHSCYVACDPDASTSCATDTGFPICKPVTTSSGVYSVCGSTTNLGSQCDPTRNIACSTSTDVCIDGYCR